MNPLERTIEEGKKRYAEEIEGTSIENVAPYRLKFLDDFASKILTAIEAEMPWANCCPSCKPQPISPAYAVHYCSCHQDPLPPQGEKCCDACYTNNDEEGVWREYCKYPSCRCHKESSVKEKLEAGAKDFDERFLPVMKELAEEETPVEGFWEREFDDRFGRAGFRANNVDWKVCAPEIKDWIRTHLAEAGKQAVDAWIREHKPIIDFTCSEHTDPIPTCFQCGQNDLAEERQRGREEMAAELNLKITEAVKDTQTMGDLTARLFMIIVNALAAKSPSEGAEGKV